MARGKAYTVAGREFERQGDLDAEVKAHLNSHPLNTEFEDAFLAAVVNEHHPKVIAAGQHVVRFQYLDFGEQLRRGMDSAKRHRGGKLVMGYFEPLGDWRDVTVYPWRIGSPRGDIKAALREKIARFLPRPVASDRCERNGCTARGANLEYQHIKPTFDEIAEQCLALMSDEEISTKFGYSKFESGKDDTCDLIPDDHPAVQLLLKLHVFNDWEWLCAYHHRNVTPCDGQLLLLP